MKQSWQILIHTWSLTWSLEESSLLEAGEEDSCINGDRREIAAVKNAICPNITADWQKGVSAN